MTERLMGVGDDWVKYHSAQPESLVEKESLGKWQDTADLLDDAIAELSEDEGTYLTDAVTDFLESTNPLTDAEIVFTKIKAAHATWVDAPSVKGSLTCYKVQIHPRFLLDEDTVVFEFSGPGILSSLLHPEFCLELPTVLQKKYLLWSSRVSLLACAGYPCAVQGIIICLHQIIGTRAYTSLRDN